MQDLIMQIGGPLIAVLVPLVVAGFKKLVPNIPTMLIPVIAALLGPLFDLAIAYFANVPTSGVTAALYGLAGIGLRELKDQLGKAISPNPSP